MELLLLVGCVVVVVLAALAPAMNNWLDDEAELDAFEDCEL